VTFPRFGTLLIRFGTGQSIPSVRAPLAQLFLQPDILSSPSISFRLQFASIMFAARRLTSVAQRRAFSASAKDVSSKSFKTQWLIYA
jgi:hypothetical protein